MFRLAAITATVALLAPDCALAEDRIDSIAVRGLADSTGQGTIDWSVDSAGGVAIATVACRRCHVIDRRHRSFAISREAAAKIITGFSSSEIEGALEAPCMLPNASAGWARRIDLNYRLPDRASYTGYFADCRSTPLDALDAKLKTVGETLLALEPRSPPAE